MNRIILFFFTLIISFVDCHVHRHYAAGGRETGSVLPAAPCGGVHRLRRQAHGTHGANRVHGVGGREEEEAGTDPGAGHRSANHHLRQPEEGGRRAGQVPGENGGRGTEIKL